MANNRIVVRGAREHNLKSIDVELPCDQFDDRQMRGRLSIGHRVALEHKPASGRATALRRAGLDAMRVRELPGLGERLQRRRALATEPRAGRIVGLTAGTAHPTRHNP